MGDGWGGEEIGETEASARDEPTNLIPKTCTKLMLIKTIKKIDGADIKFLPVKWK